MQNLDERLARTQTARYLRSDRPAPHAIHDLANDGQGDIGFDQGTPHVANRIADILIGKPSLATNAIRDSL